jgi:hypothetical protein
LLLSRGLPVILDADLSTAGVTMSSFKPIWRG